MATTEIPFSQLVRHPKATVAQLEASPRRRLRLERRDGGDLILESAEHAEADAEAANMTTRLFMALMRNDDAARMLLWPFPRCFRGYGSCRAEDVRAFLVELVEIARACAELHNMAPVESVVAAWRHTAEVYADPSLREAATRPLDDTDYGPVPEVR